jgi:magnesium chelatase family protein
MDRMDIQKYVGTVDFFKKSNQGQSSFELRQKIKQARAIQIDRYKDYPGITWNAQLNASMIHQFCQLDQESLDLLRSVVDQFHYSGRAIHKYIKIARTIADLEGEFSINISHLQKSLLSRDLEKDSHIWEKRW